MNMTDKFRGIHVEAALVAGKFVWIIKERLTQDHAVEVAASLEVYDKPSEAYRAGETVLRGMVRMAKTPQHRDDADRLHSIEAGAGPVDASAPGP